MMKAVVRTGLVVGIVGAAVYAARRYFMSTTEKAADTLKTNAKEINSDLARKEQHLTESLGAIARKVG